MWCVEFGDVRGLCCLFAAGRTAALSLYRFRRRVGGTFRHGAFALFISKTLNRVITNYLVFGDVTQRKLVKNRRFESTYSHLQGSCPRLRTFENGTDT
jgi:hypothetical protein